MAVAIGLLVAVVVLLVSARAGGRRPALEGRAAVARSGTSASPELQAEPLPPGWHEVRRPLTDVLVPTQVFAAATYPVVLHHRPGRCGPPPAILAEMPPGGALLQVIEYPPRGPDGSPLRVPRLPRRPAHFSWADATWGPFECAGPSWKFDYRQAGRALQAQVWIDRRTVDPGLRVGALRLLDRLR